MSSFIEKQEEYIKNKIKECGYEVEDVVLNVSSRPEFGDYQYNGVMAMAKAYGKNPREIATEIVESIKKDNKYYDIVEQLKIKHPKVTLQNNLIHDNYESIRHAYDKYEGIANKPDIRELIVVCYAFLEPLYIGYAGGKMVWNIQTARWQEY